MFAIHVFALSTSTTTYTGNTHFIQANYLIPCDFTLYKRAYKQGAKHIYKSAPCAWLEWSFVPVNLDRVFLRRANVAASRKQLITEGAGRGGCILISGLRGWLGASRSHGRGAEVPGLPRAALRGARCNDGVRGFL